MTGLGRRVTRGGGVNGGGGGGGALSWNDKTQPAGIFPDGCTYTLLCPPSISEKMSNTLQSMLSVRETTISVLYF